MTAAVDEPPPAWAHYVSAKCAIEGFARAVASDSGVPLSIARPPRLRTDLTNVPLGHTGALPPEQVAAAIVRDLADPADTDVATGPGETRVMIEF